MKFFLVRHATPDWSHTDIPYDILPGPLLAPKGEKEAEKDESCTEAAATGSIGLVSHGGPIALLLQELGIDQDELAVYRTKFDTTNPLPPAGVWEVERNEKNNCWNLRLKYTPSVS